MFLRRQDYLRESQFAQMGKTWYEGSVSNFLDLDLDFDSRLARFELIFGRERILPLLYHDDGRPNAVFDRLINATGTVIRPEALVPVERQNVSLHRRKLLFLAAVPKPDPDVQDLADIMTRVVTRSFAIRDDDVRFILSPTERRDLVANHLVGNRAVVARFAIPDPEHFLSLPDEDPTWMPPDPITPKELAAVHAEAVVYCARFHPSRFGIQMARKIARAAPLMAWRRFVKEEPAGSSIMQPRSDLMPRGAGVMAGAVKRGSR